MDQLRSVFPANPRLMLVLPDHSFSHHDCLPYYLRTGDKWTPIDYSKHPNHWMKPLEKGPDTGLVEIPANWYLDDLPPMMFIKKAPNSHGWVNPRDVEDLWRDHFDFFYREYDDFCFPVTIHPDVSGHPHVILMLERYVSHMLFHFCLSRVATMLTFSRLIVRHFTIISAL